MIEHILVGLVLFAVGFAIAFWVKGKMSAQSIKAAEVEAVKILKDAERSSDTLLKEAKSKRRTNFSG